VCALTSTKPRRNSSRRLIAGAVLALTLSVQTGAFAQTDTPPANTQVITPKQVGAWTVIGWSQGYCAAERPLPGAAGGGATLQFVLARFQAGYRLALGSQDWELKPQTTFPIELIAHPVLHSDASAIVVGPKLVVIELGADGQFVRKLTTAPMIEVKAAQATFKLPLEGFGEALTEVDSCFGALKRPASNPFATPEGKPSAALPKGVIPVPSAAPARAAPEDTTPIKVAITKIEADRTPSANSSATAGLDNELLEERTFLTVQNEKGRFRLEALVVRPAKADGRLPIALITHGKNAKAAENQALRADMMLPQARDFAARGWLAVVVVRRGYGQSDGLPGVSRGAAYMACENADLARGFEIEADDLDGALKVVATRPDADGSRAIAVGQSLGGGVVLAFAARRPAGLLGVINVSGGAWRTNGDGKVCEHADLVAAMATFGARTRIPTLWLYAENDSLFPPELATRMRDAYATAGGLAELRMFPPVVYDGHRLFADFSGRVKWLRAVDGFLQTNGMPNANVARAEMVMSTTKLAARARPVVDEYLSTPAPKLLLVTPSGAGAYWVANPNDIEGARKRLLTNCRERSGAECTVVMENNELVRPLVTGAVTPEVTAR
jgi:pimeloyl-ACP methyl ester carboxylesterase